MKILLVHNHYQNRGGEDTALDVQATLLEQYGHSLVRYTRDNGELKRYGWSRKAGALPSTLYSGATYREVTELVAREKPAIAHVHNVFPLITPSVYRALRDSGVPVVQTIHNFRFLCPNSLFFTGGQVCERCKLGNTLHAVRHRCHRGSATTSAAYALTIALHRRLGTFAGIDHYIALTPFAAGKLVESGLVPPDRITVLGNFLPEPLPYAGPEVREPPYALFIGRLSQEKGATILLEAMRKLPRLRLKILGAGPEEAALREQVALGGMRNVEFAGYVTGEAKWEMLRRATVTVLPSLWYENFPFAALESMAAGTPVVASRIGSLPYVVREGVTGLLFCPGDAADLAGALGTLTEDPAAARRMGRAARAEVEEKHTGADHYRQLSRLYETLIRKKRAARRAVTEIAAP